MNIETDLQSTWGRVIFSAVWAGILAGCWRYIHASTEFQALESRGSQLNWALALLFTIAVYLAILTLLLWIGLAVYLLAIRKFGLHTLARGLGVMLFALFAVLGIESFIRLQHLPTFAEYILRWLPMFVSLFAGCRLAVPRKPGELFSRAAAKN